MCAQKAIPPENCEEPEKVPLTSCMKNQKARKKKAGISINWIKKKMGTRVTTRALGKRIKYAPMIPAIAPLAPMVGI